MPLRRLGKSKYSCISRREMYLVVDAESCRRCIDQLKDDPAAMRDLRATIAERNHEIRRDQPLSDGEVKGLDRTIACIG